MMEPGMTDSPAVPETSVQAQRLCEKCRHEFPLEQYTDEIPGLECVCRRCLGVMGYRLKGRA
jgi:hypothetical protein